MANEDIKKLIKKHRLFRYEVADAMGISEGYLSTLFRKPLSEEMRTRVSFSYQCQDTAPMSVMKAMV